MELIKPIPADSIGHALNIHAEMYMDFLRYKSPSSELAYDTSAAILSAVLSISGQQLHTAVTAVTMDEDIRTAERGEVIAKLLGIVK